MRSYFVKGKQKFQKLESLLTNQKECKKMQTILVIIFWSLLTLQHKFDLRKINQKFISRKTNFTYKLKNKLSKNIITRNLESSCRTLQIYSLVFTLLFLNLGNASLFSDHSPTQFCQITLISSKYFHQHCHRQFLCSPFENRKLIKDDSFKPQNNIIY